MGRPSRLFPLTDTAQNIPVSADLAQIFEPIRGDLEAVEQEFVRHIQSRVALIPEMGRYIQSSGGKRVRPAVLLMASRLCGYKGDRAVLYASVVEFIHTATLVHDDSVDHSALRRGMPTVNAVFSHQTAVIMGDYLYSRAIIELVRLNELEPLRVLARVTNEMTVGEMRQLTAHDRLTFREEEYGELVRAKTASLLSGACEVGALGAEIVRDGLRRGVLPPARPGRVGGPGARLVQRLDAGPCG